MTPSRRQQPLFEVLSETQRQGGLGGPAGRAPTTVPPRLGRPVVVEGPPHGPAQSPADAAGEPAAQGLHRWLALVNGPTLLLAVAGLLIVVFAVYTLGYRLGEREGKSSISPFVEGDDTSGAGSLAEGDSTSRLGSGPPRTMPEPMHSPLPEDADQNPKSRPLTGQPTGPRNPAKPADTGVTPGKPQAQPPAAAPGKTDPREAGRNYLEICTLVWKDADAAVAYLGRNGIKAAAVPAKAGVDPQAARDKNLPHLVFVTDGVPSDRFRATAKQRDDLVSKVQRVGRQWQREERGPSDFSQPMWRLFKGQ